MFHNQEEYEKFLQRHRKSKVKRGNLKDYQGKIYLGIDAGSTTTKVAAIGEEGELLYSYYGGNGGDPIKKLIKILKELYDKLPEGVTIAKSVVTGYGVIL